MLPGKGRRQQCGERKWEGRESLEAPVCSQGRIDVMPSWESDIQAGGGVLSPMRLAQGSQGCDVKSQSVVGKA